jgi:hypothetical protein
MANKQKKGTKRQNRKKNVGNGSSPIPQTYKAQLVYFDQNTLTGAGASVPASYGYGLNNLFDPDFSGAGTQPLFYDQLSAMYNKYRVYSVKIELTLSNETEETCMAVFVPTIANSAGTNPEVAAMQRMAANVTLGPKSGGNGVKVIRRRVPIAAVWGVDNRALHPEDDFSGLVTGGPNNVVYGWVMVRNIGTTIVIVRYTIKMTFQADFHMPLFQASS